MPPELVEFVPAEYPPEALAQGLEGRVVLLLRIDAVGRVVAAEVATSAGHGFDEAAQDAALRFRFEPARRGEAAVPARISYAYDFHLPPPIVGAVAGRVLLPGASNRPVVGAEVMLVDAAGRALTTRSDSDGCFRVDGVAPGRYMLRASLPGSGTAELPLAVAAGQTSEPTLRLLASEAGGQDAIIEVTVEGESEAERLRRSAQAVHVIETEQAQRQSAGLGEVLARSQGVGVRRGGGLGSGTRFSLNGLSGDQVRFFLDGVPLERAGYSFGVANVPVNLIERVEVYRGVVPIRIGADALGGAVNLVTDDDVSGTHAAASYQLGSFGTHRLSLGARGLHPASGVFVRAGGFMDAANNDYPVDVEVPDQLGRLTPARVYRFHDAYRAAGGNLELGVVDRSWAERLLVRVFVTDYAKELQSNAVMTVPYGDAEYGALSTGASARYRQAVGRGLSIVAVGGYSYTATRLLDVGECVRDWFGRCVRERRQPGEIEARPRDQVMWEHSGFGRLHLSRQLGPGHALRLAMAPTYTTRSGDERRQADPDARDPLSADRSLLAVVSGVEHELDLVEDRLENIAFVKGYLQRARSREPLPGGMLVDRDRDTYRLGVGDALRYRLGAGLHAKLSYEWATRLPRPDEVFGDGVLVIANLGLVPETSHNLNLGLVLDTDETAWGVWRTDVNGFLRAAEQLIVLLGNDRVFSYENVFDARSLGVEAAAGWTSPGRHLAVDGNLTYVDFRNTSREGTFADFAGDRIPNRPYLFANAAVRLQLHEVAAVGDELALIWNTRYVHGFFRGWESVGLGEYKQRIPAQRLHSLALTYLVRGDPIALSFTGEAQNLTDQPAFDFFGVQRPGRAFYFKTTAEF
ncbi:TonB-dependent siderophore myxochelin receptor MxcH [Haliangium sp.]|uniref:TonB-dependent siderophore myxochelin receptor MxcH n=1 Tax=Haliangium sp. TaxID=2663208 RepID=UPI003D0B7E28